MQTSDAITREWGILQQQHEHYEFVALGIKLVAVSLFAITLTLGLQEVFIGLLMLVLWLQDAIFKTFQARLVARLLDLERHLAQGNATSGQAFQLHTIWQAGRKNLAGLLGEYLRSAMRPTVAFPYLVLLLVAMTIQTAG
ncbi:MAG: hypothetical protein ABI434_12640 [Burkholderiaceae bacterium]